MGKTSNTGGAAQAQRRVFIHPINTYAGEVMVRKFFDAGWQVTGALADASSPEVHTRAADLHEPAVNEQGNVKFVANAVPAGATVDELLAAASSCQASVVDASLLPGVAGDLAERLAAASQGWEKAHVFVAVSSVMTWSRTPIDEEDEEAAFTEEEFRSRKAHLNWRTHLATEKLVLRSRKEFLKTHVIAAGLVYGGRQGLLHQVYRDGWSGSADALAYLGDGENVLPMIHVKDLATTVEYVASNAPKPRYVLAVDQSHSTQREVIEAIAASLGVPETISQAKETAVTQRVLAIPDIDMLLVHMRMEQGALQTWDLEMHCPDGLVAARTAVCNEYKTERGLLPLRVAMLGPPAAGKSFVGAKLAERYDVGIVSIKDVLTHAAQQPELVEEQEEAGGKEEGSERWSDTALASFYAAYLRRRECRNQGYILDAWPKTIAQAEALIDAVRSAAGEEEEQEEAASAGEDGEEAGASAVSVLEHCIVLEASDDVLQERVINLPEDQVAGTHWNDVDMKRRLAAYHAASAEDVSVVAWADEHDVVPVRVDATLAPDAVVDAIAAKLGNPRNYGPSAEELVEAKAAAEAAEAAAAAAAAAEEQAKQLAAQQRRALLDEEHAERLAEIAAQEDEQLELDSQPLRKYLMANVMPTLTKALLDVERVRPDDPIDYLAEYLFKANPVPSI